MYVESVGTHQLGKRKGCGELAELSRLQSERSDHQPRMRTLDVVRIEDGGKEQQQQHSVYNKGEGVVDARVGHHDDKAKTDAVLAEGVAGTADAQPSKCHQGKVEDNGYPVHLRP